MTDLPSLLEPITARGWPPLTVETLGAWRLHAAHGFSGRANACWPIGAPDRPLDQAIAAVEAWYQARGLPPLFRPADIPATQALRDALAQGGYAPRTETWVMTAPLPAGMAEARVQVAADPAPAFAELFLASAHDPGDAAERLESLARLAAPRAFAWILLDGAPAAIGAAAVDGDWVGLFGMRTLARHRRQGLARTVLGALSAFAREAGARRAYLQVEAINSPAITLYQSLGFETAYGYRYWARP